MVKSLKMQKLFEDKRRGMALTFLALIALILLAGSLNGLNFHPAQPIGGSSPPTEEIQLPPIGAMIAKAAQIPFYEQLGFWTVLMLLAVLITSLLSPELRKQLLMTLFRVAIFSLIFLYIIKKDPNAFAGLLSLGQSMAEAVKPAQQTEVAGPVFQPPQFSSFLSYLFAFIFVLFLVFSFWLVSRWWAKQKELLGAGEPLHELAAIARASLKEIESGSGADNAIIRCYEQMSKVVSAKRGLARENAATPAEFAHRLQRAGLPREPVEQLTRLFESVRYGGHATGAREVKDAVASLNAILHYCGESL